MRSKTNEVKPFNCPAIFVLMKLIYLKIFWEIHIHAIETVSLMLASGFQVQVLIFRPFKAWSLQYDKWIFCCDLWWLQVIWIKEASSPYIVLEVLVVLIIDLLDLGVQWSDRKGTRMVVFLLNLSPNSFPCVWNLLKCVFMLWAYRGRHH